LCQICGESRRFIEGVALDSDLQNLVDIVEKANNATVKNFQNIERSLRSMGSYSKVVDQKFSAMNLIIHRMGENSRTVLRSLSDMQIATLIIINTYMSNIDDLVMLRNAMILLTQGILTTDIVPFKQATKLIQQIEQHVHETSFLHLLELDPLSWYKNSDLYAVRTGKHIHVGLRLKLSPFRKSLALFRVETFSLAIPGLPHSSVVVGLPKYIALAQDEDLYLSFAEKPALQRSKYYYLGNDQHEILERETPSCVIALFEDQMTKLSLSFDLM
jgi:hypothetical protein